MERGSRPKPRGRNRAKTPAAEAPPRLRRDAEEPTDYAALFRESPDAILVADAHGVHLDANPAACRMLGRSREELRGRPIADIIAPEGKDAALASFREVQATGRSRMEARFHRPDGSVLWAALDGVRLSPTRFAAFCKDITDRKAAEQRAAETNEFLNTLVDAIASGVIVTDEREIATFVSRRMCDIIAAPPDALLGDRIPWDVPEPSRSSLAPAYRHAKESLQPIQYRDALVISRADEATYHSGWMIPRVKEGRFAGMIFVAEDVTALRQAERSIEALLDAIPESALLLDAKGVVLQVNETGARRFRSTRERLIGGSIQRFAGAAWSFREPHFAEVLATGRAVRFEDRRDGRDYENYMSPVLDHNGRVSTVAVLAVDITERQRDRRELADARATLEAAIEQSPIPAVLLSLPDGVLRLVNRACLEFYGVLGERSAIGLRLAKLRPSWRDFDADGRPVELADWPLSQAMRGVTVRGMEMSALRKDGQRRWDLANAAPVYGADGQPIAVFAAFTDITERKRAEQQALESLAEKTVLLREVHHRVKNSLQAIIHLIDAKREDLADEAARDALREIQEQARTMSLVYEQLYQASSYSHVDMGPYLHDLARNVTLAFAAGRAIEVAVDAAGVTLDIGAAMPVGLIVNELLTNAFKHAFPPAVRSHGRIAVRLRMREAGCELSVRDDGVGLPADRDPGGEQSLGLRLVELWATHQLGGRLETAAAPGAAFVVSFPMQPHGRNEHG